MAYHDRPHNRAAVLLALGLLVSVLGAAAATDLGDWSAPENLGSVINTEFAEFGPHISKDGLSLYFASTRPEPFGSFVGEDLWVSQRASADAPWGPPINLGQTINTVSNDRSPTLSRDGHYLFFASNRAGGLGGLDVWVSWRPQAHDDFGWQSPINLTGVNSPATDAGPSFFENDDVGIPQLFIASNRAGGLGGLDIYVSALVDGWFQPPVLIQELSTPQNDLSPTVRHDGREVIIGSGRPGGVGGLDLWVATRITADNAWSTPMNLGVPVNSPSNEEFPSLSADRRTLFFTSNRPDGFGAQDIYVSTRQR